jgi:thiol-disulfide isomerase/thioredoxin
MNRIAAILASILALLCVARAHAAVNVGDKPQLEFQAVDGSRVSLENLRGKIVLIDFWATWCGPCMAEADHMVKINEEYGPKGLAFIGISLDQNKGRMLQVCDQQKFTWPQYFDGLVWKNRIGTEWGVNSIPATFLIDPDGVVAWKGHSAGIDRPLAELFRTKPPRLVDPKVVAEANKLLDQTESALKANDAAAAMKVLATVPADVRKDPKAAQRIDAVLKSLGNAADEMLAEADALAEQKKFADAASRLRDLSKLTALPASKKAADRLATLVNNPEARAQLAAAEQAERDKERVARADEALAAAKKVQREGKHEQAYTQFKSVTRLFANTPAADAAAEHVAKYEKDPVFVRRANEKAAESKARSALSMAANYKSAGRTDKAREKLQSVIDEFPGTSFAETARKELAALNK